MMGIVAWNVASHPSSSSVLKSSDQLHFYWGNLQITLGFWLYNEVLYWPLNWSQKPPEAASEVVNYKIFLGEHAPRHP